MSLKKFIYGAVLTASTVLGSFDGNLNYGSPSRSHGGLGIDVGLVARRSWKRGNVAYKPSELHFTHGVASGDPWAESVILWTRIAPSNESDASNVTVSGSAPLYGHETERYIKADPNPICVEWKVFKSKCSNTTQNVVASGKAYTTSDIDYTVKVEATGLSPKTKYWYQFNVCGSDNKSPIGRTKTAPTKDDDVSKLSFAVFSCSNFPNGYFNAYGNAARKDQHDYVIHLGDYIYEYNSSISKPRVAQPNRLLFTLQDYRTRHGQYRSDPDLQLLSQKFAWITTWDDHEFADNGYKDGFANLNNTEDSFLNKGPKISVDSRKLHAVRAYFEWMPIRQTDMDDGLRVWRSFQMGKLMDLIILDTRNYDRSITDLYWNSQYINSIKDDPSRSLMGARQENWFYRSLSQSNDRGAKWRIVGNQIVFSRIYYDDKGKVNGDAWDGYAANRNRTLQHLYDNKIGNNIFLAGDTHQNWVADVAWQGTKDYNYQTGAGAVGVEFAGTAVSSSGFKGTIDAGDKAAQSLVNRNEELMWQEGYYRGYFHLSVGPDAVEAKFYGSPSVATRNPWDLSLANFTVPHNANHLQRPIANGRVEGGAIKDGEVKHTNVTLNTETGKWDVIGFEKMYL